MKRRRLKRSLKRSLKHRWGENTSDSRSASQYDRAAMFWVMLRDVFDRLKSAFTDPKTGKACKARAPPPSGAPPVCSLRAVEPAAATRPPGLGA